jgi:uncharacterized repeat protein (TIGR01451 family)
MTHKLRVLKSVLLSAFLLGLLFGALALLPALAQGPEQGRAAPDVGIQALPSTTGYAIDDGDTPGFSPPPPYPTGEWLFFAGGGYQGDCIYTDVTAGTPGDAAQWRPDLDDGVYQVQVHYWANSATQRDDALYQVFYDGGSDSMRVDQQRTADGSLVAGADSGWFTLGRYPFARGTAGYVELSDSPTVLGTGTYVVADGVRFLPETVWVDNDYTSSGTNDGHLWGITAFDNIQDGIAAVAEYGTVNVLPGTYYQYITVTRPISVSGAGPATTFIVVPASTDAAVELLSSDATISGFTIQSTGATYGIVNRDFTVPAWVQNLTGYRIANNVIHGFDYGIRMYRCGGEIDNNEVYDSANIGIWVQDCPTAAPELTTVSDNVLHSNGTGGTDVDIQLDNTYTGTLVIRNEIAGDGGASEVGIYVHNAAEDLTLSANSINGCTEGVLILQDGGTNINQKVKLYGNTITSGYRGVHVTKTGGTWSQREVIIGGSVPNANSIYDNSDLELRLYGYSTNVTATYNYWGLCTYREIEDEIRHFHDNPGLGTVTYEPALCVPHTVDVDADPTSLPADGISTSTITAIVRDVAGNWAQPGTMVGITTSLGTVPWGYAEAEDTSEVTRTGTWATNNWARASGGQVLRTAATDRRLEWTFMGPAVSVLYAKDVGGGVAEVRVDGTLIKTIDMASTVREFRVEEVITTTLDPSASHTIEVRPDGTGNIWVDAFRSGGVVVSGGRVETLLTAASTVGVAEVWATVYDGHIITATSVVANPVVTDVVTVAFEGADLEISKSALPASINASQEVTYTITYENKGPQIATHTQVTDTLPLDFVYVRSTSDHEPPTFTAPRKWTWDIGDLAPGEMGSITVVARPDPAVTWCAPDTRFNAAEIVSSVEDPVAGDNQDDAPVGVVVPTAVALSADPPSIRVSEGTIRTTLRITVTDSNSNLVHNVPVLLTTTDGTFPASGTSSHTVTTIYGKAVATLASSPTVTTAMVTAEVLPSCGGMPTAVLPVPFVPDWPAVITSTAYPTLIQLCGDEAVITATVRDRFGHLVADGTQVNFNVVQGERGEMFPRVTTTLNGIATSTVRTKGYLFGARSLDVYILSRRETQEATALQRIDLEEGPPDVVSVSLSPSVLPVGGREAEVRARVQDCGGNNVKDGTTVTFAVSGLGVISPTVTTTSGGWAYAVFTSNCTMGQVVITATADSKFATAILTLESGPADLISVSAPVPATIRNCGDQAVIEATVYDLCGNLVKDGTQIQFAPQYGYVSASPELAYTINGKVSTTVTSLSEQLHDWPVTLEQIDVVAPPAFPGFTNLNIRPGLPGNVDIMADPGEIPINGDVNFYDIIVEAFVGDCGDTPVEDGTSVMLKTDLGIFRESGMRTLPRTTATGWVTGTLTSQSIAGWVTLTATADSQVDTTNVRFLPGDPWLVEVWGIPQTIRADGRSTSGISALVMDEFRNPVMDGIDVEFVTDYGYFAQSGDVSYTTSTDINGYAIATLVSDIVPRTALVRAIIVSNSRQGYSYVFFTEYVEHNLYLPLVMRQAEH